MARTLALPIEIEALVEGGYLALCPDIAGCHAEGNTIGQAIDNLQEVAQVIYELCQEQNLAFVMGHPEVGLDNIVWKVDIPLAKAA